MERLTMVMMPQGERTRVLAMRGTKEVLRAELGPAAQVHRLAAPLLLEGLSLWEQMPVSVVLCVDERGGSSPLIRSLCADGYRLGDSTLCYQVQVVVGGRGAGQPLGGVGEFRSLRRLCLGGARWP